MRRHALRRLTPHNAACLYRYLLLRLRFRNLHAAPFSLHRGADIRLGRDADVRIGRGVRVMRDFTGHFYGRVAIGDNVFFNRGCHVVVHDGLSIGDNCLFGEGVSIHDANHVHAGDPLPIAARGFRATPIRIGRNVWVGAKATVLPGVRIGDNAVIGANAVEPIPKPCEGDRR